MWTTTVPAHANVKRPRYSLGDFLRAHRDRAHPEDFGLRAGTRRRAPGLRREEVAVLCGISPTWYTWIEQGRTSAISGETLGAIARGLHLSRAERAYLFELAARADRGHATSIPADSGAQSSDTQTLAAVVRAIRTPAYVLDRHWEAVAWNPPAAGLFAGWLSRRRDCEVERSLLRYVFLDPGAADLIVDWRERATRLVAEYRADSVSMSDDPVHRALVEELCWGSTTFATAWRSQQVAAREGGERTFNHPRRGRLAYQQLTLRHGELKLVVLIPHAAAARSPASCRSAGAKALW